MKKPFRISEVDLTKILYSNPILKDNKKSILLKYQSGKKTEQFLIQTPELICIDKPIIKNSIYEINIALNSESEKKVNNFINFIKRLEEKIISLADINPSWFNDSKANYNSMIRAHSDYKNGFIKLKIKNDSNISKLLKVTKNKQTIESSLNEIDANNKIKLVLDIYGLWIKSGKDNVYHYGIYTKPVLVDFEESIDEEISFREDSESDDIVNEVLDTEIENNVEKTKLVFNENTETSVFNTEPKMESNEIDLDFNKFDISSDINFGNNLSDNELEEEINKEINNESSLLNEKDNIEEESESESLESNSDEANIIGTYNNELSSSTMSDEKFNNVNSDVL